MDRQGLRGEERVARARVKTSASHAGARQPAPAKSSGRRGEPGIVGSAKSAAGRKRAVKADTLPNDDIIEIVEVAEPVRSKVPPQRDALYFDSEWYLTAYPDVAGAGVDAATHYRTVGYKEGRRPNAHFDGKAYVAVNPDLLGYEGDLFLHYVFFGAFEGRPLAP